ncbi:MAG: hypothetical protein QGH15_22605, partial [Kiritimatiellia bacterium]|nr:hypothetical protein [Kiritimatiellia bacterium]
KLYVKLGPEHIELFNFGAFIKDDFISFTEATRNSPLLPFSRAASKGGHGPAIINLHRVLFVVEFFLRVFPLAIDFAGDRTFVL